MTPNQVRFGLMPVLDAVRELPRTILPLKSVRYHFTVEGGMAEVEMTQIYGQDNSQPLDCEYLFPLPADGAVYRCEVDINGRTIRARVEEREAALRMAAQKKAEGHRTALVESERDNLFTLSLGNIQPQDVVEVKLAYVQPLRRLGQSISFDLPLCPGIRYIPGDTLLRSNRGSGIVDDTNLVPDASRISPPRIDADHPDAAFIELDGHIEGQFLEGEVGSPSHKLTATRHGTMVRIALAKGGEVPDRDLALRWKERACERTTLRGWVSQDNGNSYALLELRAPAAMKSTDTLGQDFYFLVDRSGSMAGLKWRKAVQALQSCVAILGPNDRACVTLFDVAFKDFDAEPVVPAVMTGDPRFARLASLGTGGGTNMAPALRHVLELVERFSNHRPAALILITDAQIGNEREVVTLLRRHSSLPVHCFGIDTVLNDSLLLDLVRQQGGTFHALQPKEDVAAIVTRLGSTLRQPVLVNVQAPAGWELAAGAIPNLYAGQIHLVSLRSRNASTANNISLPARDDRNAPVSLDFDLTSVSQPGPRLRWGKERLVALVARNDRAEALALSKEFNLLCPLTAFVAWDEQRKVEVASHRLVQPALELAEMELRMFRKVEAPQRYCLQGGFSADEFAPSLDRMGLCEEPAENFPLEKRQQQARFSGLAAGLAKNFGEGEWTKLARQLMERLDLAGDTETIDLFTTLMSDCERILSEWIRCDQRLRELIKGLPGELPQIVIAAQTTVSAPQNYRERIEQVRQVLPTVEIASVRRELNDTINEMVALEARLRQRMLDFLQPPGNSSAKAPLDETTA